MTITVDTAVLDAAGSDTIAAMTVFSHAVSTALGALGGPGMTGTDPAGLVVGQAYDEAAQGAVEAIVDVANGCARIGDLLRTSAYNYAIANHYSAIKPGGGPPTKPAATKPYSTHVPPKGEGSLSSAPFGWGLIQSIIGMVWPNGDPGRMRAAAQTWNSLTSVAQAFDAALVRPENSAKGQEIPEQGQIGTAFGDASHGVTQLGTVTSGIAKNLNAYAQHVDDAHTHLRRLIDEALHLVSPSGLLDEFVSLIQGKEDQLRQIAHEALQVLNDLKVEADAIRMLLEPLVQAAQAAARTMGAWANVALHYAEDVAQVVAADTINAVATVGNAALHHPEDLFAMAAGAELMAGGAGLEVPGVLLDATGVGALIGVPVNVAGAGMIAAGATMAGGGAIDLGRHAALNPGVTVMHAHTGRPGEGINRGDGRDIYGHITGRGEGYGRLREAEGLEQYRDRYPGRWVTNEQRKASVDGAENGRFYDGLARKPDGTYEGVEVKSGGASLSGSQRSFDAAVSTENPAHVTITNERGEVETVEITSVRVETVPAE
ncbi:MAG: NAD(+)--arginine ADP-ribosyltransferase [Mycobacterium sp.]|nr:MAG: NAD(+)--arginine ADP-ribosyltransferase [Mycobacterium sp.]